MISNRYRMNNDARYEDSKAGYYNCPICNKQFYLPITCPPSTYAYKLSSYRDDSHNTHYVMCCSWKCLNEARKIQDADKQAKKKQKQDNKSK